MSPEFPLRIISDDGSVEVVDSPDALMTHLDFVDSTDPRNRVWVRDVYDRTVRIRVRGGMVEVFELA
ncbi:MAG TPA: hypothetical protein VEK57_14985 [Thermoanaerobaculia bacterium]|nr:hypothetical protein [Thermoanaerobaculia bacterium]